MQRREPCPFIFPENEETMLYRAVQEPWFSHWTPDRKHAEDHLRAHNEEHGLNGGIVEYR
ncbi:MAG: hypothetical protein CMP27_15990 [Roseibacillus sp.]|nr:hypothetical protein [Roseibacillus sp.]